MEMYLALQPGSSSTAMAVVLSHRNDMTMEEERTHSNQETNYEGIKGTKTISCEGR